MITLLVVVSIVLLVYLFSLIFKKEKFDGVETAIKLLEQGNNIFVTGGAGTGKSYILGKLKKYFKSNLTITSTTGISALNVNGQTIHSWSGIGIANTSIQSTVHKIKNKNTLYTQILCAKMLAIDEISMLDNKTLDYINETLKAIRNNSKPFGGIQVLLFGDFFQLPPVELGKEGCDFCFNSKTWKELNLKSIILKETKRQTEKEYIQALNNIRVGFVTPEDTQMFKCRENESRNINSDGVLHIFGTNEEADTYNSKCFEKVEHELNSYYADDFFYMYDKDENSTIIKISNENYSDFEPKDKKIFERFNNYCKAPRELQLKVGSRVMLIKNIDVKAGLVNGSCGTVAELNSNSIVVLFDNDKKIEIEKVEFLFYKDGLPKIKRMQYPLRLAYGITIHKSQGMTFDSLVVDFHRVFSDGQGYVALSRTRTLQGLILNNYAPGKVSANPKVIDFYEQLEKYGTYKYKSDENVTNLVKEKVSDDKANIEYNSSVKSADDSVSEIDDDQITSDYSAPKSEIYINLAQKKETEENIIDIINSNKIVEIEYISKKNNEIEITTRTIKPISIHSGAELNETNPLENGTWDNNVVYIKAFCYLRDEERTFRIDRIKSMKVLN